MRAFEKGPLATDLKLRWRALLLGELPGSAAVRQSHEDVDRLRGAALEPWLRLGQRGVLLAGRGAGRRKGARVDDRSADPRAGFRGWQVEVALQDRRQRRFASRVAVAKVCERPLHDIGEE